MQVSDCFPNWSALEPAVREGLTRAALPRHAPRGTLLHNGSSECTGLLLVKSGQLRVFIPSEDGREVTLYRLLERDVCLFSAACLVHDLQVELSIQAQQDTDYWLIPPEVYRRLMASSPALAAFTNQLTAGRFSDVVWLIQQILWKRFDQRRAAFLLEERSLSASDALSMTHEAIANHLGTAREVVTRMLKYFRDEGLVRLGRGSIELTDVRGLEALQEKR